MTDPLPHVPATNAPSPEVSRALDLVRLRWLMERSEGSREIVIGLLDGPVAAGLERFPTDRVRSVPGAPAATCHAPNSAACMHGTFVAAILSSARTSTTPAICPGCTLLVRPVLPEATSVPDQAPSTAPTDLAAALIECVEHGARILNISLGVLRSSPRGDRALTEAIDVAAQRGALVVVAAGNRGTLPSSALTSHPWVIPVAACDLDGVPLPLSNIGASIGRRGLAAPGTSVPSLVPGEAVVHGEGTSVAAPFVTGALALLWSLIPDAAASDLKQAILRVHASRRPSIVPPLLDAERAFAFLRRIRK